MDNDPLIEAEIQERSVNKGLLIIPILSLIMCVVGCCVAQPYIPIAVFVVGISVFNSLLIVAVYLGRRQ